METGASEPENEILAYYDEKRLFKLKSAMEENDPTWIVLESEVILSSALRDNLLAYKVVKELRKGRIGFRVKEIDRALKNKPVWRLIIDAHIMNIINKDMLKRIIRLRKKSEDALKKLNTDEAADMLKAEYYMELMEIANFLVNNYKKLRAEWKARLMDSREAS